MPNFATLASILIGFGLGIVYVKLVAYHATREQDAPQADPHNALQRAVYEPTAAPRPVEQPSSQTPVKRGPGRPRKSDVATEQYVGGGTRNTRSFAPPIGETRRVGRHKIN